MSYFRNSKVLSTLLISLFLFVALASSVFAAETAIVPDEVFVKINSSYINDFDSEFTVISGVKQFKLVKKSSYPMLENVYLMKLTNVSAERNAYQVNQDMKALISALENMSEIEFAQPNFIYTDLRSKSSSTSTASSTAAASFDLLWGFSNTGQTIDGQDEGDARTGIAGMDGNILRAWEITKGKSDIIVVVADDGVDPRHPEFAGRIIQDDLANPVAGYMGEDDGEGDRLGNHGTHVAGTIAASYGSGKIVGVAPGVTILPVNILGNPNEEALNEKYATSDNGIAAIKIAIEHGAKIINNSWGSERWQKVTDEDGNFLDADGNIIPTDEDGYVIDEADETRIAKVNIYDDWGFDMVFREAIKSVEDSILYIVAAGNDDSNNDLYYSLPDMFGSNVLYDEDGKKIPPLKNVFSIAAIDNSGLLTDFTHYGKNSVHIAAPGWGIYSAFTNNDYGVYDGTSMAAPFVSGIAALMYSVKEDLTPAQVIKAIMDTGRLLPAESDRELVISGKMVDAYAALVAVGGMTTDKPTTPPVNPAQPSQVGALTEVLKQASPWAVAEITNAYENNLTTTKVMGDFTNPITREEFCELVVKLYEALSGETVPVPSVNKFNDTKNPEILKANALGIVNGIGNNLFAPNNNISREEIAVMFYRTMAAVEPEIKGYEFEVTFADKSEISSWALKEIGLISELGILGGVGNNRVNPKGQATRQEAIALVLRTFNTYE